MRRAPWRMVLGMMLAGAPAARANPQSQNDRTVLPPVSSVSSLAGDGEAEGEPLQIGGDRVAYFPESIRLDEDHRRLWDSALRTELARLGLAVLPDEERMLHVRSARTLGLGCQLDTSPACLAFLSELAALSYVLVATGSEERMGLLRLGLRAGELIELGRGEVAHPAPGASHAEAASALVAQTFLEAALPSADPDPMRREEAHGVPGAAAPEAASGEVPSPTTHAPGPRAGERPTDATESLTEALGGHPALIAALIGGGMVMGGGASLAASQWLSHTPFQGALPSSERVKDRLAWVDATQWAGFGLLSVGASVGVAGVVLAAGREGAEE